MKKIFMHLLVFCLLLTGCGQKMSGEDLMKDVKPSNQSDALIALDANIPETFDPETDESWENALIGDFAVRLFQASFEEGKNTLISPYSVLCALAMTANGAEGETLVQMEEVLGQSTGALNSWHKFGTVEDDFLHMANGIWFREDPDFTVEESFLQTNADYFGAEIYKAPFDDTTLADINGFVEENTNGMVRNILDKLPDEAVMYLVNALAFQAQWEEAYKENQVHGDIFTTEDGRERDIELMYSEENRYLENELATGFIKPYKGGRTDRYAFAVLLPKKGVTLAEMVQGLDGKALQSFLANPQAVTVNAAIPKFEVEYDVQMHEVLKAMGMIDAFRPDSADFSRMGTHTDGRIYISRVLHKTFLSVAEQGTRAGAATVVEVAAEGAMEEMKRVVLDRPFLYMIVDTTSNTPIFIGAQMDMGEEAFLFVEPNENGHVHLPAEDPGLCAYPTVGYCGNIVTTVKLDGREYSFMYDDSVALTDILTNQLTYDPNRVCRCITDITVETELGGPYYVNLQESFARCEQGQATLTEKQIQTIQDILSRL